MRKPWIRRVATRGVAFIGFIGFNEPGGSDGLPQRHQPVNREGSTTVSNAAQTQEGPKYEINLDGDVRTWSQPNISVAQIRELAGWGADQPVVMVDLKTNDERDLHENEVVELKPGHGFSKKIRFKRGVK